MFSITDFGILHHQIIICSTEAAEDTIKEATEEEAIMTGRVAAAVDMVEEIVTRVADTKSYMVSCWRRSFLKCLVTVA